MFVGTHLVVSRREVEDLPACPWVLPPNLVGLLALVRELDLKFVINPFLMWGIWVL